MNLVKQINESVHNNDAHEKDFLQHYNQYITEMEAEANDNNISLREMFEKLLDEAIEDIQGGVANDLRAGNEQNQIAKRKAVPTVVVVDRQNKPVTPVPVPVHSVGSENIITLNTKKYGKVAFYINARLEDLHKDEKGAYMVPMKSLERAEEQSM